MYHSFDIDIAKKYGIEVSVFVQNIAFWIKHNFSNDVHFHDDRYWTYNTQEAFIDYFPYWNRDQIKRIIKKSYDSNLIIKGNFNKLNYDRTTWFSLTDEAHELFKLTIGRNCPMEKTKMPISLGENAQPIPDNKPDNKQHIKDKRIAQPKKKVAVVSEPIVLPDWLPSEAWEEFKQHRKQLKKPMSELAQKKSIKQLEKMRSEGQDVVEVIEASIANGWQGLFEIKSQGVIHGKGNSNSGTGRKEKFDSTQWLLDRAKARARGEDPDAIESHVPVENIQYLWNT